MRDFADVVLDNKAPKGDAVLYDPRVPQKFVPVSGVTSNALLQALVAATIEELLERGITPPVLLAANVDGGGLNIMRGFLLSIVSGSIIYRRK